MLKFEIRIEENQVFNSELTENQFWGFIDSNEICTVQADIEHIQVKDKGYYSLTIVPEHDEEKLEFMKLCSELVEEFELLGYRF